MSTDGSALDLGDGDDTFEVHAGAPVATPIDGGEGNDTLKLMGPGAGTLGTNTNFETLDVQSGVWTLQSDAYDTVTIATGAIVTSQVRLADQGDMKVAVGGSILVTNGSNAVVAEGAAAIENAGLIQALGLNGAAAAGAISLSGGSVYNKAGGIILAQGVAVASDAAPAPGVELVNEGMIQSLSGQAIAFAGDAGDLLVNTRSGVIVGGISTGGGNDLVTNQGSVVASGGTAFDLGDGNDTLNLHGGSAVTGKIVLGAGNDVLSSNAAGALDIDAGDGQDSIATGDGNDRIIGGAGIDLVHAGGGDDVVDGGADDDRLQGGAGNDQLLAGAGNDVLIGGTGNDLLSGGDGVDTADYSEDRAGITVDLAAGTAVGADAGNDQLADIEKLIGGSGNDTFLVSTAGPLPSAIGGGAGNDTIRLLGNGTGALAATSGVEGLVVQEGTWSVVASDYAAITIEDGATVTSTITLNNDDRLTIEAGGKLAAGTAIVWAGGGNAVVDNAGLIEAASRVLNTTAGATGSFTFNNEADGVVRGSLNPQQRAHADATVTINNSGLMEASGRVIDFQTLASGGADVTINNLAGGTIRQTGSDTDVIRPGQNTTVNNWGMITTAPGFAGGGDLIDFQSGTGGKVNNHAGGWMEASRHAVTGDNSVTVLNEGTMIGRNGSAVNIDNGGSEAEKVFITNRGTMEGRSAELVDSDGDAIDVDGLAQVLNYGRIAGLGAEGYHDGEPNVSEGIAIGGGSIVNNATGEIYGYGRAIQVDNSSNANALGVTTIVNDGLIRGDGHGPEGVAPADAARFDLRGNEAINLVGDYEDFVGNNSTGRIVGGISMGGGRDTLNNSGSIVATGGSAINMGAGNDQVNLYVGATVAGTILLGAGDDVALSTSAGGFEIDGGDGNDTMAMDYSYGGDDILRGGAGADHIYAGAGKDRIDGGLDDDMLHGNDGDDWIDGGAGDDTIDGGAGEDTADYAKDRAGITVDFVAGNAVGADAGADRLVSIEKIVGGSGDDTFRVSTAGPLPTAIDGGAGDDTVILVGSGVSTLAATTGVENLVVQDGTWSVTDGARGYSDIVIKDGATVTSDIRLDNSDVLTIEHGGSLRARLDIASDVNDAHATVDNSGTILAAVGQAIGVTLTASSSVTLRNHEGGIIQSLAPAFQETVINVDTHAALEANVVLENAGTIEAAAGSAMRIRTGSSHTVTLWNHEGGVIRSLAPMAGKGAVIEVFDDAGAIIEINNAGLIQGDSRVLGGGSYGSFVLNNLTTGVISGSRVGPALDFQEIDVVNNAGRIVGGSDGFNYNRSSDATFNNLEGGYIEGVRHAITGKVGATINNAVGATMVGLNGSAVNIDNKGTVENTVYITNRGTMEGRAADGVPSDGDAIDVDGLVQVLNYGRIAGLGADGYHNGEPNVSEGMAIGGGSIVNNATGEIYGYGRAIQVDNSSNGNALGVTTIVNDGLIRGDGHGPEGVAPADAARFDLRGNEAINLIGDHEDFVGNNSTGRIVGGISMGGGRDTLNNSGSIVATGGSAIDMGAGNDQVNLYVGSTVSGTILLGAGDDVLNSTSAAAYVVDGGDGNDSIAMYYTIFGGDDVLSGGAGNDHISGGLGEDRIDGGLDNDTLYGEDGDDLIQGGAGDDRIDGGADDDVIFGDAGNDTIIGGLGSDTIKGNAGDDIFVVTSTADGRDSYDGGAGIDTIDYSALGSAVTLTLRDGTTSTFATDTIENVENVIGGSVNDRLTGNSLANTLTGNAGDDVLKGAAGNDILDGGTGNDDLDGGADNDRLSGGAGNDVLKGGAGDDVLKGGAGTDTLTGGAGFDRFWFDSLSDGIDTITDFKLSGASEDRIVLSASMFQNFTGDDAFDLIGSGYLRASAAGGQTQIQVDLDGGGNSFQTLAIVNGTFTNGVLADHLIVHQDQLV
ncbi:S-layer family protein [Reyranella sp. CPCC 100927]|uniref:beta strand repeat-containing protein n=1 Tax=Reyranella sp. CPCC 100927 TaxID=2599616 RepID=UPI0015B438E0|nr:hypothetical protein [Reyranella sp. CPCC 100927]